MEEGSWLAALDTELDDALLQEGLLREIVRSVQEARKQAGLQVEERIALLVQGDEKVTQALNASKALLMRETLAEAWSAPSASFLHTSQHSLGETGWTLSFQRWEASA